MGVTLLGCGCLNSVPEKYNWTYHGAVYASVNGNDDLTGFFDQLQ